MPWSAEGLSEIPDDWKERLIADSILSKKHPKNRSAFQGQRRNRLNIGNKRAKLTAIGVFYDHSMAALSLLYQSKKGLLEARLLQERALEEEATAAQTSKDSASFARLREDY